MQRASPPGPRTRLRAQLPELSFLPAGGLRPGSRSFLQEQCSLKSRVLTELETSLVVLVPSYQISGALVQLCSLGVWRCWAEKQSSRWGQKRNLNQLRGLRGGSKLHTPVFNVPSFPLRGSRLLARRSAPWETESCEVMQGRL